MIRGKIPCVNKNLSIFTFNTANSMVFPSSCINNQSVDNSKWNRGRDKDDAE